MAKKEIEDIDTKLAEYKAARADREAKQAKHTMDAEALEAAIIAEKVSGDNWLAALDHENEVEDELEAIVVEHEPPKRP